MGKELIKDPDGCYRLAEQRASRYYKSLYLQVTEKSYVPSLTKDIQSWKHNHVPHHSFLTLFSWRKGKTYSKNYYNYIQWLERKGKLDHYLDRSVSYIFMRDLGKDLDSPDTQARIKHVVNSLKKHLIESAAIDRGDLTETYSIPWLYRMAQKEGIEATLIWVVKKIKTVSANIPKEMDADQSIRKLIKIIAGIIMHVLEGMSDEISSEERTEKLDVAIRLGYSYGLSYPFIDDLLDAKVLSKKEEKQYANLIRTTLITGSVPELGEWPGENKDLIRYIHSELREAFEYIKAHQPKENRETFFEQSFVFFNSQEVDRFKDLSNANYTNEELYVPIILKSASSRLILRSVINAPEDKDFNNRIFYYGIYNQLADDFTDILDDIRAGVVTPYTYYMKYHDKRVDLINPFELYWTVIFNLIHHVYHSDVKTCEVILDRAINSLKRFKARVGTDKYNEVMDLFSSGDRKLNLIIQAMVQKADDVDFFDKLLRDHIITNLKKERKEREEFKDTINAVRNEINNILPIHNNDKGSLLKEPIIDAANYCLEGSGKRLRPILTWVMGVNEFGLNKSAIVPLLKSLEYMHTASLIFDDLPSQDNASIRRGLPTLHQIYSDAIAELTGLFLTQKAVEEQASLDQFDSKAVLKLIRYSAHVTGEICRGQAMDLESKGQQLTLEQLNTICFYKTGIAFEASLIMPAILADVEELEMEALKKFAKHAGIAFQIKDDLLDVEGASVLLGKPIGIDAGNNNSTFVSILGSVDASKAMWEHYCLAMEALQSLPRNISFLKHLLNYLVNREH